MSSDNCKYDLTEEEYQKCLNLAEMAIFINSTSSRNPKSIFIIGQPGAGKTGLKQHIEMQYINSNNASNFIEFDPDMVAVYHKNYDKILEEFPDDSYSILQRFVKPALDNYLRQRAVQLKNNIVQEGTFSNTDGYIDILRFQKYRRKSSIRNDK